MNGRKYEALNYLINFQLVFGYDGVLGNVCQGAEIMNFLSCFR